MTAALITGATGAVGGSVLRAATADDQITRIVSLGRRPTGLTDTKLSEVMIADFADAAGLAPYLAGIDTIFHCLATYSARVSKAAYEEITLGYLSALIEAAESAAPAACFCLFSAGGARTQGRGLSGSDARTEKPDGFSGRHQPSPASQPPQGYPRMGGWEGGESGSAAGNKLRHRLTDSLHFSLRVKGKAENRLFASALTRTYAFRPGYIAPSRPRETPYPLDRFMAPLFALIPALGIKADDLARIMVHVAANESRPSAIFSNGDMRRMLAGRV